MDIDRQSFNSSTTVRNHCNQNSKQSGLVKIFHLKNEGAWGELLNYFPQY